MRSALESAALEQSGLCSHGGGFVPSAEDLKRIKRRTPPSSRREPGRPRAFQPGCWFFLLWTKAETLARPGYPVCWPSACNGVLALLAC